MALNLRVLLLSCGLAGCDVEPFAVGTGGVDADHGLVALLGDYSSVQIALLARDGSVRSPSFLSSGSAPTSGLAFAFSGDTVLPSSPSPSGEVVLVDRFGTNVLSWANPRTAEVRAQLAIGTGFESNPHDYLELSPRKAYVSRWGENPTPGRQPFDSGGNLLVVDPSRPAVTGSIELPRDGDIPPRPSGLTRVGSTVLVVLQRISRDFASTAESWLAGISVEDDALAWSIPLGLKACGRATPSPSGELLALACTGDIDIRGGLADPSETGILLLDLNNFPPRELRRFGYETLGSSVQPELAFAGEGLILAKTQTELGGAANNALFALDLESGRLEVLSVARPDELGQGRGVTYGGLYCDPAEAGVCLMADGDTHSLRRFDTRAGLAELPAVSVGGAGLPPLQVGGY